MFDKPHARKRNVRYFAELFVKLKTTKKQTMASNHLAFPYFL